MLRLLCLVMLMWAAAESRRDRTVAGVLKKYYLKQNLLMVFSNQILNQRYLHQRKILREKDAGLRSRNVLVGHFIDGKSWTKSFRKYFHVPKRIKFAVVLLTKDGIVRWKSRRLTLLDQDVFPVVDQVEAKSMVQREALGRSPGFRRRHRTSVARQVRRSSSAPARSWII